MLLAVVLDRELNWPSGGRLSRGSSIRQRDVELAAAVSLQPIMRSASARRV